MIAVFIRCLLGHDYERLYFMKLERNKAGLWGYRKVCVRCGKGAGLLSHTVYLSYQPGTEEMSRPYGGRKGAPR